LFLFYFFAAAFNGLREVFFVYRGYYFGLKMHIIMTFKILHSKLYSAKKTEAVEDEDNKVVPPQILLNTFTKSLNKVDRSFSNYSYFNLVVAHNFYIFTQYPIFINWKFILPIAMTILTSYAWSRTYNKLKTMSANLEADKSQP
jgi:hypothetical protein